MPVTYEWDCETVATRDSDDFYDGDIIDHYHSDKLSDVIRFAKENSQDGTKCEVVLVRDSDEGRSWAYVKSGLLPDHFDDAYGRYVAKVPLKYRKQFESVTND